MSKFKKGDKIKVVSSKRKFYWYSDKIGQEFILDGVDTLGPFIIDFDDNSCHFDESDIKLLQEKEMFDTNFDMKSQPWFIRVTNEQEYNAARKWLFENFGHYLDTGYASYMVGLSNTDDCGEICSYVMWMAEHALKTTEHYEIELSYKTVVDSVQYPQVETEQQKKVRELQETIEKAQKQIEDIQKSMK